ncbi:HAMP domain-containing sensor histidine kinase [Mucilaginibacter sp. dw_454]|uniref:sensor histidine kinase n=1 Tax=Mucilaginibacter sp. dw_454 TaxID=2720079 RepID=UPI001BD1D450|nr:HAMP domain-containing sensor histidine kinase [Mucilaginibacter sp. dw_454]
MKLRTKLTLFNALSKLVIVTLFVLLLPLLIRDINQNFTDNKLQKQKSKILRIIKTSGIKDNLYATYSPLKEEFYSLDEDTVNEHLDTIKNEKRKIEGDTIAYRILSYNFVTAKKNYLLEIGKSVDSIGETSAPLQNIAFVVLIGMILLTILADVFYTNRVLNPLSLIIKTKLIGQKFPNFGLYKEVKTTTSDFQYLDISIHKMIETIEVAFQKEREFISNASHELMTPISILQSKIENMFDEEDIADELKVRLLEMQKILNRLKSITKTLLLISQIENEQFLKEDKISITELLQEVYDEINVRLADKNLTFDILVPNDVVLVNVNRFLIFNLFFNLVNNAIKYNKADGEIVITTESEGSNFIVNITDTGMGISAEDMPFIFNRFKKFRQSMQQDSFGLGLPIVKSIATFHNIKIEVDSVKDMGSNFRLILPAQLIKSV